MIGCVKRAIVILAVLGGFCFGPGAFGTKAAAADVEPGSPASAAADNAAPAEKIYTGERISLEFKNADIHDIIKIISEVSGKKILLSENVSGKITLKLKDMPWDQALDIILESRNLGVEESGDTLTVYDLPTLRIRPAYGRKHKASQDSQLPPLRKKVFTPKYSPISMVSAELNKIKSDRGKMVAIGNDIYVEDDPGTIATMTQIFMRIDRVAPQVLIEARIVEASAAFAEKYGFQRIDGHSTAVAVPIADGTFRGTPEEVAGPPSLTEEAKLDVVFLNKANTLLLNAKINASEPGEARTISAPRIMAVNGQEVTIKQGQPMCVYTSGSSATTAANVHFKDIVAELNVRPHIEESGNTVTLDIRLINGTWRSDDQAGDSGLYTDEIKTTVTIKDGETTAIGGLIPGGDSGGNRIEGRKALSLMDWLDPERRVNGQKPEMLIFITANIIPINI